MTTPSTPPTSVDPMLEVRGYSTDPKLVGYQLLTNYENTYWRAVVGNTAWSLYEILRGFCHNQQNICRPSINLLMTILGIEQRRVLTGWTTKVKDKEYKYPGLIEILQQHKLAIIEVMGIGPKMQYIFHVNLTPGLLTDQQIAGLPPLLQKKHEELLKRCAVRMRELEAKRRPPKVQVNVNPLVEQAGQARSDNLSQGLTNCQRGSDNLSREQYQHNNTQVTASRAREDHNNNSSETSTKSDVVVAFSASKIASEETSQASLPESVKGDSQATNLAQGAFTIEPTHELTATAPVAIAPTPVEITSQSDVSAALLALGLADTVTERLTSRYSAERIAEKIEFLAYLQEYAAERVKNPRGWLRRAIEENYGPPDGFLTQAERTRLAVEAERQAQTATAYAQSVQAQQAQQEAQQRAFRQRLHDQYGTTAEDLAFWEKAQEEIKFASISHPDLKALLAGAEILKCTGTTVQIGIPSAGHFRQLGHPGTQKVVQRALTRAADRPVAPEFVLLAKAEADAS